MAVVLKLGSDEYTTFQSGSVSLKYASIGSTFSLTGLFDVDNEFHRKLFKPLSYPTVKIFSAETDELLLTGTVLNVALSSSSKKKTATISGYSKTGVLSDSKIPVSSYPIEFNGLSLRKIAELLIEPFNLSLVVSNDDGIADEVIPEVSTETNQSIERFLVQMAAQRNLIITHNQFGQLVITRANTNVSSIATYRDEGVPTTNIGLSVKGQAMHSELSVLGQTDLFTDNASEQTIENVLVGAFRPTTKNQTIGTDNTAIDAVRNVRASEMRNIQVVVSSDRWEWLNSHNQSRPEVAKPNNIIDVISPENYIANRTQFFVEQAVLSFNASKQVSVISAVPPQVYNNEDPVSIFS